MLLELIIAIETKDSAICDNIVNVHPTDKEDCKGDVAGTR